MVRNREVMAAWAKGRPSKSEVGAQEKEWTELWRIKVH
jgi:hypothetical protein